MFLICRKVIYDFSTSRIDRINRIPYLLERWKGRIVLSFFMTENDILKIDQLLQPYLNSRIDFVFYVVKYLDINGNYGYYIDGKGEKVLFNEPIFPLNLMRDLSIESIKTTHYLLIDIDFFISSTFYTTLNSNKRILERENSVILIPTFVTAKSKLLSCREENNCESLYIVKY